MRRLLSTLAVLLVMFLLIPVAQATNGDTLIGIGPISRAMGGAAVAAPQDAISAIFASTWWGTTYQLYASVVSDVIAA